MGVLEFMPATMPVLRKLAAEPEEFAAEQDVVLHAVSQEVGQQSLEFLKSFAYETRPESLGYFVIEQATRQMVGTCSWKGPPHDGAVEIAYYTFPGYEGRGIATEMARFLVARAQATPGVERVIAYTAAEHNASTRILEKIGMQWVAEAEEDGMAIWRWEL